MARRGFFSRMFRRRPKAAREPDATVGRQGERRSKKSRKAPPPGPLSASEPPASGDDEAAGDESSEPWYRQSGPLFDESFNDGQPAPTPQPPGGEAAAEFTPPLPADPAAAAIAASVPIIQRVGQVTDPGPLSEEMLDAFRPTAGDDDEPADDDEPSSDEPAADDEPSSDEPEVAAPRSEPGIGFDGGGGSLYDPSAPLIDFDSDDDAADAADAVPEDAVHETIDPDGDAADAVPGEVGPDDYAADAGPEEIDSDDDAADAAGAVPEGAVHEDAVHEDAVHEDAVHEGAVHGDAVHEDAVHEDAVPDDVIEDGSALPAEATSSEVAPTQHEPPMVVPVRGYYIARTEDTLRSVAAQFLNAPERWSELRALNAAYPGIADLDPDELVPEGAALALPGDPLPWGRPDPVYLWTLAETFLFTAWGREPSPEEVVPFWRGLTQGALPEGEQSPLGIELPDVAQIAARSAESDTVAPPEADVPPTPPAAFEMPAIAEPEDDIDVEFESDIGEPVTSEALADTLGEEDPTEAIELDTESFELDTESFDAVLGEVELDVAEEEVAEEETAAEPEPEPAGPAAAVEAEATEDVEPAAPVSEPTFEIEPPGDEREPEAVDAELAAEAEDEPDPEAVAVDAPADIAEETADDEETDVADIAETPPSLTDTAELASLIEAVEEAVEQASRAAIEAEDDDIVDAEIVEDVAAEPAYAEPEAPVAEPQLPEAPVVEPPPTPPLTAEPSPVYAEPATPPPLAPPPVVEPPPTPPPIVEPPPTPPPIVEPPPTPPPIVEPPPTPPPVVEPPPTPPPIVEPPPVYAEPAAPPLAPPPTFEEWIDEPPAVPPPLDPSAPYAGMPGASTAEAPPRPPEAEAPRVPHFLPSVTGTAPSGLTAAAQTSPLGRSLAGTAVGDAMLLLQLARRRRQSQRGAGVPDAIEQSLLQSAGSESLELIEAAMRHLYAVTVGQQRPKPNVLAVRSGTYGFEVLLDGPVPTPPGWRAASGGFVLELPQGVTARDLGAIGQGPSLCPALVPVGNTFEGPLLLNLEQLGCLTVSGPSASAAGLLSAIVGTLGSSPMADHLRITAVGFENAAGMIGWEAVSFASYDSPELESLLANAYGPGDGMIELLVIGPGNDLLIQRAGQVATAPESRLSLVGATSAVSARWPWRIHVDDTGTAIVHPISITMTAARAVPPETLAQFGSASGGIDPAGLR